MQNELKKWLSVFQSPKTPDDIAATHGAFVETAVSEEDLDDGEGPDHAQQ